MKRAESHICCILITMMVLPLCACGTTKRDIKEINTEPPVESIVTYTDAEIEAMAVDALVYELYYNAIYPINRMRLSELDWYDLSQTRYKVASIVATDDNEWTVKGTIALYDSYGRFKDTGTFTAYVKANGYSSCIVNIDT